MTVQAIGVGLMAAGALGKVLGKDTDYPALWGAIRIDNGVAKVVGDQYALDTGDKADALRMATAYADYMNGTLDAMGLTPEQRATISTPGITVGLVAGDRPGAVSEGGFFFGQMDGGSGWMSGITANNQGFSSPESAMNGLMAYAFNEAIKPDLSNTDWKTYAQNNVDRDGYSLEEAYLDYKYDQQEEGRGYASLSTWMQRNYEQEAGHGNWPKIQHPTMDADTAGRLSYVASNPPQVFDFGLGLAVPEKFNDSNFWNKVGGVAMKVGAAMAAAGYTAAASGTSNLAFGTVVEGGGTVGTAAVTEAGLKEVAVEGFKQWLSSEISDIAEGNKEMSEVTSQSDDEDLQQILWNIDEILKTEYSYEYKDSAQLPSSNTVSSGGGSTLDDGVQGTAPSESGVEQVEGSGQTSTVNDGTTPSTTGEAGVTYGQEVPEEFNENLTSDDTLSNTAGDEVIPEDDVVATENPDELGVGDVIAGAVLLDDILNQPQSDAPEDDNVPRTADGTVIGDTSVGQQTGPIAEAGPDISSTWEPDFTTGAGEDIQTGTGGETGTGYGNEAEPLGDGTAEETGDSGSDSDLPDIDIPSPTSGPQFSDFGIPIYAPLALEKYRKQRSLEMPEFLT